MKNSNENLKNCSAERPSSGVFFDAPAARRQLETIEKQIAQPDFWQDQAASAKILTARRRLEEKLETDTRLERALADLDASWCEAMTASRTSGG